jgi:hypothetical protein
VVTRGTVPCKDEMSDRRASSTALADLTFRGSE